jgi:cell division protein FtsQ
MAQTIKRGGAGVRKQAAAKGTQRKVAHARRKTGGAFDRMMHALPFAPETLYRIGMLLILGLAAVIAWQVAKAAGVLEMARAQLEVAAADAGFSVKRVEVRGVNRMNELKVYEMVLGQRDRAMPELDIEGLRTQLLQLPWVGDARVSRQLPDTLVIDIVERTPRAVLRRKDGSLALIDATGHELETVTEARAKGMLIVSGNGVSAKIAELDKLIEVAPALKPQVAEAQWIGNRRWNLTFKTSQTLALPEGEPAGAALLDFARLDGVDRLLGGKIASFDMRSTERTYLLVPGHADEVAKTAASASKINPRYTKAKKE